MLPSRRPPDAARPDRRAGTGAHGPLVVGAGRDGRPLRIALVTEYYYPHLGGVCEHVHFFAREARRRGHHVDVLTSSMPGAASEPYVIRVGRSQPVYCNGSQARISVGIGLRRQVRKLLRAGRYDIVHVHSPLTPVLPLLAIEEATCPVIGTFHTYFERSIGYTLGRRYFQRRLEMLSAAIAVSPSTTLALSRYFDADWKIIPNGIDLDMFHPDAPAPRDFPLHDPTILFLGRFDPRNGLATLIRAFRHIKARQRRARLMIVGDGPLRDYYAHQAGGDPDIHFAGAVLEGRAGYFAHSTVYACPTTKASFGITLLESMACETPVVCSDIPGFRDVVRHEREALMVPCGNVAKLADALVAVLEDPARAQALGAAGRQQAGAYAWPAVATQVLDLYRTVLEPVAVVA